MGLIKTLRTAVHTTAAGILIAAGTALPATAQQPAPTQDRDRIQTQQQDRDRLRDRIRDLDQQQKQDRDRLKDQIRQHGKLGSRWNARANRCALPSRRGNRPRRKLESSRAYSSVTESTSPARAWERPAREAASAAARAVAWAVVEPVVVRGQPVDHEEVAAAVDRARSRAIEVFLGGGLPAPFFTQCRRQS